MVARRPLDLEMAGLGGRDVLNAPGRDGLASVVPDTNCVSAGTRELLLLRIRLRGGMYEFALNSTV